MVHRTSILILIRESIKGILNEAGAPKKAAGSRGTALAEREVFLSYASDPDQVK